MHIKIIEHWRSRALLLARSDFGNRVLWFTSLSAFDRIVAVVQTVLISRALGITEYGIYGLLFGTIGFVASIAGLQMGLTATVFVSRYKAFEKGKAAAVISIVHKFALCVAAAFVLFALPFSEKLSRMLLNSSGYQTATMLGVVFVGATILSGVQDGIAEGFEIFGRLAKLKIVVSVCVIASIYPVAMRYGLIGVMGAVLAGVALKFALLQMAIAKCRKDAGIPPVGSEVSFRSLVGRFALPSMAVSLLVGLATWSGMFLLSRQHDGFDSVAIANTGLQWRGPVLLLAASLGSVAVPAFSRLTAQRDANASLKLRQKLSLLNLAIASATALVLMIGSGLIMRLYGAGFAGGRIAFSLIVLSTVPTVVTNVHMQALVGAARMWRQLWLHLPFVCTMGVCFYFLIPHYGVNGYACSLFIGSVVFLLSVFAMEHIDASLRLREHESR